MAVKTGRIAAITLICALAVFGCDVLNDEQAEIAPDPAQDVQPIEEVPTPELEPSPTVLATATSDSVGEAISVIEDRLLDIVDGHLPTADLQQCLADSVLAVFPDESATVIADTVEEWPPPEGVVTPDEMAQAAEAFQSCASFDSLFDLVVEVGGPNGFTPEGAECIKEAWNHPNAHKALAANAVYGKTELWTSVWEGAIASCPWEAFIPALRNIAENAGASIQEATCAAEHVSFDMVLGMFAQPTPEQTDTAFAQWNDLVAHCYGH